MALNGLDAEKVNAAHEAAIAEPSGWFLLHYVSRDEIDLLNSGTEGFTEARDAVAKYEEESPLFGLVIFKKKKALLKYVPEGTSRLLQVRLAVHLQSVLEKFPHDALLSLTSASDLTESALSSSLTQLKSSNSVRSTGPRIPRPLTEIPEDSDEASQRLSQKDDLKEVQEVALTPNLDSPPDPLLFPASQPFSPARLQPDSAAFSSVGSTPATSPAADMSASTPSGEKLIRDEAKVSLDGALERPSLPDRATTYEPDVSWSYKPKVKLGPRPSLDQDVHPRASGSFSRPVATLPAGIRMASKNSREPERPQTQHSSSKPFHGDMPRYAAFVPPAERPKSRAASIASVPAYSTFPTTSTTSSPVSPTSPAITPEKRRLMKALQQRKQYQAKKAEAEAAKKAEAARAESEAHKESSQNNSENTTLEQDNVRFLDSEASEKPETQDTAEQPSSSNTPETSNDVTVHEQNASDVATEMEEAGVGVEKEKELTPTTSAIEGAVKPESAVQLVNLPNGNAVAAKETVGEVYPKEKEVTLIHHVDVSEERSPAPAEITPDEMLSETHPGTEVQEKDLAGAEKTLFAPSSASNDKGDNEGTLSHTGNKQSIEKGVYLAHSGSPSSTEVGDNLQKKLSVSDSSVSVRDPSEDIEGSHLPSVEVNTVHSETTPHIGNQDELSDAAKDAAAQSKSSVSNEDPLQPTEDSKLSGDSIPGNEQLRPSQGEKPGEEYESSSQVTGDPIVATTAAEPWDDRSVTITNAEDDIDAPAPRAPFDSGDGVGSSIDQIHHGQADSVSTVKAIGSAIAGIRDSHHRPTDSSSTVKSPISSTKDIETSSNNTIQASQDSEAFDKCESSSTDLKRSSAASKASKDSTKKRPPPLTSSKHNSSDLASLDGDSLYEELRSATVEEARPMIVSRSPATPVFQDAPRPTSRRDSDNLALNRVASSPSGPLTTEPFRPKLVQTTTPPSPLTRVDTDSADTANDTDEAIDLPKARSSSSPVDRDASRSPTNGNSSPRKGSGVSSLISQRIKAFEMAKNGGRGSPTDRTAVITPSIVSQRKASLTTPPSSSGADSLNGARSGNRPYPTPSPSPQNGFVARTFGSVRVSSNHAQHQANSLHRQSSRESANNVPSTSSSRLSSVNTSPSEVQKPTTSYFSVPAPMRPKDRSFSATATAASPRSMGMPPTKGRRSSTASSIPETKRSSRASFSSRRSTTSQASNDTARPMSSGSPRSESSFSSDGNGGGDKADKKPSRRSRLLRRMSSIALSPRRNIAHALGASLSDQAIEETKEPAAHKKWSAVEVGDVNVQFPDTLLWKRRHLSVDARGNLVLKPSSLDKSSKIAPKQYYLAQFRAPYIPDQDREEMPHSVILDFQDGSTLQCSCADRPAQTQVLQILRNAHAAFSA